MKVNFLEGLADFWVLTFLLLCFLVLSWCNSLLGQGLLLLALVTSEMWHVTCNMIHVTCDISHFFLSLISQFFCCLYQLHLTYDRADTLQFGCGCISFTSHEIQIQVIHPPAWVCLYQHPTNGQKGPLRENGIIYWQKIIKIINLIN